MAARPHVEAAKLAGASRFRLATRHLLPGALPNAFVAASLDLGTLILTVAALSFLGLGTGGAGTRTGRGLGAQPELFPAAVVDSGDAGTRCPGARTRRERRGRLPAQPDEEPVSVRGVLE